MHAGPYYRILVASELVDAVPLFLPSTKSRLAYIFVGERGKENRKERKEKKEKEGKRKRERERECQLVVNICQVTNERDRENQVGVRSWELQEQRNDADGAQRKLMAERIAWTTQLALEAPPPPPPTHNDAPTPP
jgi:hypothetical protein